MRNTTLNFIYSSFFILSSSFASAQQDSGFTNKAEAQNLKVKGEKDGKWVEYFKLDNGFDIETKNAHAPFYKLIVYKEGKPVGIGKEYYKSGKLRSIIPYKNGNINGVLKEYDEAGQLIKRDTVIDSFEKGLIITYNKNGSISAEFPYTNDRTNDGNIHYDQFCTHGVTNGVAKYYDENGKLRKEVAFANGELVVTKNYDENGKVVK